jgi:N-methylhydantoinase B
MTAGLSEITLQIMWNRLIAVVEEQAQTLIRTAFSTSTREAGDLSAGVFLTDGRMVAQAVTGTPGHVNSMAAAVGHFLTRFPIATMQPGDVYVTNDPWLGTGHLHDFTVVTPAFQRGRPVALFACTSHVVDIGGIGLSTDGRQIYHEGLYVPIMKLAEQGRINEVLLEIVRANVREPIQVEGDLYSLAACNDTGQARLLEMMDEFAIDGIEALGAHIIARSQDAMLDAVRKLPFGTYRNRMTIDGYEQPVDLVAALTISDAGIDVDFAGTSPISAYAINVPLCYTEAYASFGVRCLVGADIPNNAGSLAPVRVTAPVGSILNAVHPAPVAARHVIGQMLPDTVFGCLHQAVPGGAPAEGTSCLWNLRLAGGQGIVDGDPSRLSNATRFNTTSFHSGGTGARPTKDGLSATAFPSGVKNVPIEITESITPLVFWRKEYRADSGGAGRWRGGLGQVMELTNGEAAPFSLSATFDRIVHPPRGREGGGDGTTGRVGLASGPQLKGMGRQTVPEGDRLIVEFPGGGGYGDPATRDATRVAEDVRNGFVSPEAARTLYRVALTPDGAVDQGATRELRTAKER